MMRANPEPWSSPHGNHSCSPRMAIDPVSAAPHTQVDLRDHVQVLAQATAAWIKVRSTPATKVNPGKVFVQEAATARRVRQALLQ
jgi:hypothetical protein